VTVGTRVVLIVSSIVLAIGGFLSVLTGLGWDPTGYLNLIMCRGDIGAVLFGLGSIILALRLFTGAVFESRHESNFIEKTELGEVRVSLRVVEDLVQGLLGELEDVDDVHVQVRENPDHSGILISVSVQVQPGRNIPQISDEIRRQVQEYIGQEIGIRVADVGVEIRGVSPATGSRA